MKTINSNTVRLDAIVLMVALGFAAAVHADDHGLAKYADPAEPALPETSVQVSLSDTALVITDPQIDFLSPEGVTWGVVGESVTELGTVDNIGRLLDTAKAEGLPVFVSPHHYYPSDHGWKFEGPLEKLMHAIGMFDREGPYVTEGFDGSGSDFMPEYKAQILDGETVVTSPHKIYGPETNDLVLQLRKRGIEDAEIILQELDGLAVAVRRGFVVVPQDCEVGVFYDAADGPVRGIDDVEGIGFGSRRRLAEAREAGPEQNEAKRQHHRADAAQPVFGSQITQCSPRA